MSTFNYNYNYIIIGAGAAGLNLALAMNEDVFFKDKKILILDKDKKTENDRTWCFWEKGNGKWDHIVSKTWKKSIVTAKGEDINFDLKKYTYKMLRSADFYQFAKTKLDTSTIEWKTEDVQKVVQNQDKAVVTTPENDYMADFVFDSRIPSLYTLDHSDSLSIAQHFKGWIIETEEEVFDDTKFTMMDYSIKDGETTSFTYVLPMSPTKALVEFTYFSPDVVSEATYDHYLKRYISEKLHQQNYKILETEKGVIPMTNFPFEDFNQKHIIKIGTAGGWVKASSGYSFKNCEKKSKKIIKFLKTNPDYYHNSSSPKFKHYDKIFLEVLSKENHFGEELFHRMYKNNSIRTIFRFLDERSVFSEDLKIILNLSSLPFINAFLRHVKSGLKT
ncbi:lycopene beta cyclase [Psychroflexus torquis ATCC 700755]|uniref:Lycopene beta cyclase n=1 Tax=Psychroflexus torquis (strain ATCC 700755 / CIP 106069 / ACAM 623) TaxID=313595 RepID=K4IAJ6_PSYTT|nr:lycopene cyclase family protein [Psychroflexus torquis]AFU67637.1 lycopene beta cyclase [Psychroflexus torquis ATCC 700755]